MEHDKKGSNPAGRISFLFYWIYTGVMNKETGDLIRHGQISCFCYFVLFSFSNLFVKIGFDELSLIENIVF